MLKDEFCTPEGTRCVILRGTGLGRFLAFRCDEKVATGPPLKHCLVPFQGDAVFGGQSADILAGVGCAGQGCVHVDIALGNDFLERHVLEIALLDYLLLFGRQAGDEILQVLECALVGKRLVCIRVVERGRIVHLHVDIIVRNELRARVLAKVVRHQVMRNAGNPRVEAVVGRVFPLTNLENSLHERILKEVVRKVSILLSHK